MVLSSLGRKLAFAAFAAMIALGAAADAQPPVKVLFLGHSMTRHGPAPKIGWTNDWGMAASARERDYAHLVARGIEAKTGRKTEIRLRNIAAFERNLADFDMAGQFAEDRAWGADYTVIFIGENCSMPKTDEEKALFRTKMRDLYRMFKPKNGGDMVACSVFSPSMVKAQLQREAAEEAGVKYVKFWDLGVSKECKAIGKFWHPGVAGHPGDKGMALMAERILDAFFPPSGLPIEWKGDRLADWWKNEDIAEMHVEGDSLKGLVSGRDAQLHAKLAQPLEPKGNRFFTFRMKVPRGGKGQLFWIHRGAKGPSETFQKTFWVIGDDQWHDYKIRPGWCGPEKISILRFDFPGGFAGGTPFELADIAVVEEGDEVDFLAQDACGVAFSLKAPPGINYYALEWSGSETASGALHFSTPPDGREHAYWFDLENAKTRGKKGWAGRIMNFAVRQPFADRELKVENFRFLKERPSLLPDPVITSAIPSEAVPRAGRPFVVEAVVRNFGTLPAEHLRFSFDGLPDGVKPLDADALVPAEPLPGSNGEESLNHDCGPQLPHERVFKFRLSDLGAGKRVFGLSVSADGVAPRRIEVVADVKPSLNLPRLDYPAEPKPVDTAPYTIGALMFPGWVNHKWHAVWSHDHARKPVLGWYDEESPETVDWQIKFLVENGISFVSVCWYWRNGVPSRNHWMQAFRQARYRKYLKWHVMWDNGYNSLADQEKLAHYWCTNCFDDVQYHRIDGKPVVAICGPIGMEQRTKNEGGAKRLLDRTREIARSYGFPGVYFVAMRGMGMDYEDPAFLKQFADYGFDVTTVYGFRGGIPGSAEFDSRQRTFKNLADMSPPHWRALHKNGTLPFWPSISTGYDDRPWRGERVLEIRGYNVADFARICREARKFGDESGVRTFLLGPLDEWGEGSLGYPNHAQGFGILESVREAFGRKPSEGWPVNYAPEDVGLRCPQRDDGAKSECPTTEWRRLAFLPAIKPDARVYRHIVNLGRTDWRVITPLKLTLEGAEGGVFAVKMNGTDLGETRADPFEVLVPKEAIRGETENELEITVREAPAKPVSRIVLSGTYPTTKGPLLSELAFFTNRLDTTIPALAGIPARIAVGDMSGARKIFADHVRRSLRPGFVLADWKAKQNSSASIKALRQKAALVQDHTLNTLGTSWHFEGPVEWEFNPTYNGYREWNYHISYFDCGDPLAELYLVTHDDALARSWRELLLSFISYNPVPLRAGAGATKCWRSLDTASRMFYLTRQLHAFVTSPVCDDEFIVTFFRSVWEHGLRLRTGHAPSGNWFTNEMSSLARLSFFYPYFRETREWRDYALGRLQAELDRQVYPDGFQSELAPGYHCSVMRHFLSVVETARECGEPLPPAFAQGVERMFLIFPRLARPDLRSPNINDSGNASGGPLARAALRHYPHNDVMRWFATERREGRPPEWLSCEMPYAGFAALRNSWDADGVWAFLDGGPFGMAHQHEDKLNVLLSAYGKNMVVEAGTFAYDTSEMRKYVLSTRAHNTVRIDGLDQNRRKGYRWKAEDIARKSDLVFRTSPSLDWAEAVYEDGYGPSKVPVRHARRLVFYKNESGLPPFFVVVDRLSANDGVQHAFEQIWHLETCTCETLSDTFNADFGGGVRLTGVFSQPGLVDKKGQHEPEYQGWMPIHTGDEHEHRAVHTPTLCGKFEGALRIVTVFMPSRGAVADIRGVRASDDPESKDYTIILSEGQERTFTEQ